MPTNQSIAYCNGSFQPLGDVRISPLDRGFLFADGVYEVVPVYRGRLFRLPQHLERLRSSLGGIRLAVERDWAALLEELVVRNGGGDLAVYLQVTRGAPPARDHAFPTATEPTVFAMAGPLKGPDERSLSDGISTITVPDGRWHACHIKSVALLANVLARQQAVELGADDAILIRDGVVLETSAGNLFVIVDGVIHTAPKDHRILPGITRDLLLELAAAHGMPYREQDIPAALLARADEVWTSSSTKEVMAITRIDGRAVGDGRPGPVWQQMWQRLQSYKRSAAN